jgi:phosphoribosyl-AMP cyclohydrolase
VSHPAPIADNPRAGRPVVVPPGLSRGEPIHFTEEELATIAFNPDGLVAAIVQDASDGAVLMFAWMNEESLRLTLETGRSCFWSRSRQELWWKGETSGERQYVRRLQYDCDGDVVLVTVDQEGEGACHTGHRSCFFRAFGDAAEGR